MLDIERKVEMLEFSWSLAETQWAGRKYVTFGQRKALVRLVLGSQSGPGWCLFEQTELSSIVAQLRLQMTLASRIAKHS